MFFPPHISGFCVDSFFGGGGVAAIRMVGALSVCPLLIDASLISLIIQVFCSLIIQVFFAAIRMVGANRRWGAEVVYGDTDSLFVHFPGRSRAEEPPPLP